MKRGEIWWVDFEPPQGGIVQKSRPAIILSNNTANRFLHRLQVVPVTSQVDKLYPSEIYITYKRYQAQSDG